MDDLVRYCKAIAKHVADLHNMSNVELDHACSVALRISELASHGDLRIANSNCVDAYIREIKLKSRLDPRRTGIRGRTPLGVCCAMYGVWSAFPVLVQDGVVGNEEGQVGVSLFVNFSWDLLNWVLPDMYDIKGVESDGNETQEG